MQIGVAHITVSTEIDEALRDRESARDYVIRLAREKALAVWNVDRSLPVLAADTTVVVDGIVFGKPGDRTEGIAMLTQLSGREHEVLTAIALVDGKGVQDRLSSSTVRFRPLAPEECAAYWETGEPRDKAGGYAIQGLGAVFIESLRGSYSGVMGLPLFETAELLRGAGIPYWRTGEKR